MHNSEGAEKADKITGHQKGFKPQMGRAVTLNTRSTSHPEGGKYHAHKYFRCLRLQAKI